MHSHITIYNTYMREYKPEEGFQKLYQHQYHQIGLPTTHTHTFKQPGINNTHTTTAAVTLSSM